MRLIGREEQMAIDRLWQDRTGLPLLLLMESAATAVSRACLNLLPENHRNKSIVLVLCGKGQNGGDAYACARHLVAAGCQVRCRELFMEQTLPEEAEMNRQALIRMGVEIKTGQNDDFCDLGEGDIIVDGIFGTGFRAARPLPQAVQFISGLTSEARGRGAVVIAIDVPSGLDANSGELADKALSADLTVSFVLPKIGLWAAPGRFAAGTVLTDSIHVSQAIVKEAIQSLGDDHADIRLIEDIDVSELAPDRPADAHKGTFGRVLMIGGAPGMPGAAVLATDAAAKAGAGLVTAAVSAEVGPLVLSARPEALLKILPTHDAVDSVSQMVLDIMTDNPVVLIGPGGGNETWLKAALEIVIDQADNLLIDADGLNMIAKHRPSMFDRLKRRAASGRPPAVLTPHPGEFSRLAPETGLADRQSAARSLAAASGSVVVLKGASTVVAVPQGPTWINPTGHDGLARGGSGDVLAGLIAGLMAQGMSPQNAAVAGVYLHGVAADLAAVRSGHRAMLPTDVIDKLPDAFRQTGWE